MVRLLVRDFVLSEFAPMGLGDDEGHLTDLDVPLRYRTCLITTVVVAQVKIEENISTYREEIGKQPLLQYI